MQHCRAGRINPYLSNFLTGKHMHAFRYQHSAVMGVRTQKLVGMPDDDQVASALHATTGIHNISCRRCKYRVTHITRYINTLGCIRLERTQNATAMGPGPVGFDGRKCRYRLTVD